jgi:hypothetical protein
MQGLRLFTAELSGYLVEPQNQDRKIGGQRRDPGVLISFDAGGHVVGCRARVGKTRATTKVWPCDEEECYFIYFPLKDLYLNLTHIY